MCQITHHELLDPAEIVFVINLRFFEKKEIRNFYLIYLLFKLFGRMINLVSISSIFFK